MVNMIIFKFEIVKSFSIRDFMRVIKKLMLCGILSFSLHIMQAAQELKAQGDNQRLQLIEYIVDLYPQYILSIKVMKQ